MAHADAVFIAVVFICSREANCATLTARMITAGLAGLVAGTLHVFMGPDHLAALAPLSLKARRQAWLVGWRWGLGHSAGILVVGALALVFRSFVNLEAFSGWGERLVGAMLIALGIWGLRSLFREQLHVHAHHHEDGEEHVHFHVHRPSREHAAPGAHAHMHAAFFIGTLHGLAGVSHLAGILPSLALPTWKESVAYLGMFGLGTILAMVAFASTIGFLAPGRTQHSLRIYHWALGTASCLCALVGAVWIVLPLFNIPLP